MEVYVLPLIIGLNITNLSSFLSSFLDFDFSSSLLVLLLLDFPVDLLLLLDLSDFDPLLTLLSFAVLVVELELSSNLILKQDSIFIFKLKTAQIHYRMYNTASKDHHKK